MLTLGGWDSSNGAGLSLGVLVVLVNLWTWWFMWVLVLIGEWVTEWRGVHFSKLPSAFRSVLTTVLALPCCTWWVRYFACYVYGSLIEGVYGQKYILAMKSPFLKLIAESFSCINCDHIPLTNCASIMAQYHWSCLLSCDDVQSVYDQFFEVLQRHIYICVFQ